MTYSGTDSTVPDGDNVLRVHRNSKYKTISTLALDHDSRLSGKASGYHTYLITRPDGWQFHRQDIVNRFSDGVAAVRTGLEELEALGYLRREQPRREDGTFSKTRWTICEVPRPEWAEDPDETRKILGAMPGVPGCDSPSADFPHAKDQPHNIYQYTIQNEAVETVTGEERRPEGVVFSPRSSEKPTAELPQGEGRPELDAGDKRSSAREPAATDRPPEDARLVTVHPETGEPVYARNGPQGPYLQVGDATRENRPEFVSLIVGMDEETVTEEEVLKLLQLPRRLGPHPLDGYLEAGVNSIGAYVRHVTDKDLPGRGFKAVRPASRIFEITHEEALELFGYERDFDDFPAEDEAA